MSACTMCAFGNSRVAAYAVSTAALKSTPITSRAPHCAASCVCRPLPQPPSSTNLSLKNSGLTGASQPRNCCSYLSSVCVKCCHCQPKLSAVAALSSATPSIEAKRGTPRMTGQALEHDAHESAPEMISPPSRSFVELKAIAPAHEGHDRYWINVSFKSVGFLTFSDRLCKDLVQRDFFARFAPLRDIFRALPS